jgi:hypothetical protein
MTERVDRGGWDDEEDAGQVHPLTRAQAQALRDSQPSISVWQVVAAQAAAGEGRDLTPLWATPATSPAPRVSCSEVGPRRFLRDFKSHSIGVIDGDLKDWDLSGEN